MARHPFFHLFLISALAACQRPGDPEPTFTVTRINPVSGIAGSSVFLYGRGFKTLTNPTVFFGTAPSSAQVLTDSTLQTTVPASLTVPAVVPISVQGNNQTVTSPINFTVVKPITTTDPGVITVTGSLTANTTWTAGNRYLLSGTLIVRAGTTLTIEPGTVIFGDIIPGKRGLLIIEPGAKLIAEGTADKPIVFTSARPAGTRQEGDWLGIYIIGNAPINQPDVFAAAYLAGHLPTLAPLQGNRPADNSGILNYVRIEYAGGWAYPLVDFGLCLIGVGSGTTIDYVQMSNSGSDSFNFFGGTVNAKHLVSFRAVDDDFDMRYGHKGNLQFVLAISDPAMADGSGSNSIETSNDNTGTDADPITSSVFSNFSFIGPRQRAAPFSYGTSLQYYGTHHRRNSRQSVFNSAFVGCNTAGLVLDGTPVVQGFGKTYHYENNLFATITDKLIDGSTSVGSFGMRVPNTNPLTLPPAEQVTLFNATNRTLPVADFKLDNLLPITRITNPGVLPGAGSVLLTGAAFPVNSPVSDGFFERVNYIGAFGTDDWTRGWANFNPQITVY